jgi:hypothetical protein
VPDDFAKMLINSNLAAPNGLPYSEQSMPRVKSLDNSLAHPLGFSSVSANVQKCSKALDFSLTCFNFFGSTHAQLPLAFSGTYFLRITTLQANAEVASASKG